MAYTKYSLTPADNNAAPPNGAPEGMLPSAVNDTMRDMMSQIRDVGDGIRGGTYTMTAPVITGGSISGSTMSSNVITGGSINNAPIGASTASTGSFTNLNASANSIISVTDNSNAALRITQLGTGNALVVEDSANPDSTPFVIDADSRVLKGVTTPLSGFSYATVTGRTPGFQVVGSGVDNSNISIIGNADAVALSGILNLAKSRGTATSPTIVNSSDRLATIVGNGYDGSSYVSAAEIRVEVDGTPGTNDMPGRLVFFTTADGASSPTERMRITSAGNVGIGNTNPTSRLQLTTAGTENAIQLTGSATTASYVQMTNTGNSLSLGLDNSTGGIFGSSAYAANIYTSGAYPMLFWTNAAERMRIDSSGNVFVGRTSNLGTSRFVVESDSTTFNPMTVSNSRSTAATDYSIIFYRNSSIVGSVQTSLSATSYVTSSDYRLKENIAPMTGALDKVQALKPVTYDWKTGGSSQGFIAHELAEVCPEAVTGEKDAVNEDGSIKPQGIDTSFLVATLTAAIQELKAELDSVKAELQTLKGN